jgi:hypothetical protein
LSLLLSLLVRFLELPAAAVNASLFHQHLIQTGEHLTYGGLDVGIVDGIHEHLCRVVVLRETPHVVMSMQSKIKHKNTTKNM